MADDLVVREWMGDPLDARIWLEDHRRLAVFDAIREHNSLKVAYLAVVAERDAAKLDHSLLSDDHRDLMQDVDGLRAQLAAMTAERDEAHRDAARHIQWAKTAEAAVNVLQDQLTASGAALRKYGNHLPDCHFIMVLQNSGKQKPGRCTCGFDPANALTPAKESEA